jgi:hypothetical protein
MSVVKYASNQIKEWKHSQWVSLPAGNQQLLSDTFVQTAADYLRIPCDEKFWSSLSQLNKRNMQN